MSALRFLTFMNGKGGFLCGENRRVCHPIASILLLVSPNLLKLLDTIHKIWTPDVRYLLAALLPNPRNSPQIIIRSQLSAGVDALLETEHLADVDLGNPPLTCISLFFMLPF